MIVRSNVIKGDPIWPVTFVFTILRIHIMFHIEGKKQYGEDFEKHFGRGERERGLP